MPRIEETVEVARKVLPIIYALDTSGSMSGAPITAVNNAMYDTVEVLKDVSAENPDAELKIGVVSFSSGAQWITKNGLVFLEDFYWNDLQAGGLTDLGAALRELDDKLSRDQYLKSDTGFCVPVILFMSDGQPTDQWEIELDRIKMTNKWFKYATKIGIAVGDYADEDTLAKIVGNTEAVIQVDDLETLKKLIRVVSVAASVVNSKSHTYADGNTAGAIIQQVRGQMNGDPIVTGSGSSAAAGSSQDAGDSWDTDDDDGWN